MTVGVLVVDDSATMRGLIGAALKRDPDIEVLGFANDPIEARELIKKLNPDVVTLDVEMPHMNGIEFLEKLMRLRPTPVVMISTLTQKGAEITIEALELGAVDCIGKPVGGVTAAEAFAELATKVKAAARARVRPYSGPVGPVERDPNYRASSDLILAIGSSTGGVEALMTILSNFPETCPPTLVTQHMPATFTKSFAARLDRISGAHVTEAQDGERLQPGHVYIAPGGDAHMEVTSSSHPVIRLSHGEPVNGHQPSVDVLFESVAKLNRRSVGAILTGMGRDGASGLLAMRKAGARTLGQDESSSVVYGMPRVAFEIGAVEKQVGLSRLGPAILNLCSAAADSHRSA
jgi:two-component system chemotaxis response regulator CheB